MKAVVAVTIACLSSAGSALAYEMSSAEKAYTEQQKADGCYDTEDCDGTPGLAGLLTSRCSCEES